MFSFFFINYHSVWSSCCMVICRFMQNESQRHNDKGRAKTSLTNKYLSLYCKGSKRLFKVFTVRGSWRPNRNCNILTPLLWPSALCLSCSPDAQPEAQRPTLLGDGCLYCTLSATSLDPNSSGFPRAPSAGCGFPCHISSITPSDL